MSDVRVRLGNKSALRADRHYVLYWMIAARRATSNFALDRSIAWAVELGKPLVVFEPLRIDYPWASERLHRFILDGMADNARAFSETPAHYYPYVEPTKGAGKGLLAALGSAACIVVTDEFPCFFLPRMVDAAARQLDVQLEIVDGNGLLPVSSADRDYTAAFHFRRHAQKQLREALRSLPKERPFAEARIPRLRELDRGLAVRWPPASQAFLAGRTNDLAQFAIDHEVKPVHARGGSNSARHELDAFVRERLSAYHDSHSHPDDNGTSRLSPYLHFGHISTHEIFNAVMRHEHWTLRKVAPRATGMRHGWWGAGNGAEAFLDQLVVWRELGYNTCAKRPHDYNQYSSLPRWALSTLDAHRTDTRPYRYSRETFEASETHDALWNAAQRQLRDEGWCHNYLRMLWGKKIFEWSNSPEAALEAMIGIMNRWALDGRDPNSYAGYFWVLGRYDRPWPERDIYGKIRAMSSERAAAKLRVKRYLARYGGPDGIP